MARKFTFKKTFELSTNSNNNKKEDDEDDVNSKQKARPALLCSLDKAQDDVYLPKTKKNRHIDIFNYASSSNNVSQPQYKKPTFTVNNNNSNKYNSPLFKDNKPIDNTESSSSSIS